MSTSRVRELAKVLLQNPKYVSLNPVRAAEVARMLGTTAEISLPTWDFPPFYPQSEDFEEMCQFYATFNAINYCYFDHDGKKFQEDLDLALAKSPTSGSSLASMRLTEHWEEIRDPVFLGKVDENYLLAELFASESPISLVKERTEALRELGRFLQANTDFTFERLFAKYRGDAYLVSQYIPTLLPSWRDPFFKRSQLFVGMVYGRFQGWKDLPIDPKSLHDLTVFADYRVPQTLIAMGVIEPAAPLLTRLHQNQFLGGGSQKELELRAATISGADLITTNLQNVRDDSDLNSLHTDFLLWSAARKKDEMLPGLFNKLWPNHHLTLTTDY